MDQEVDLVYCLIEENMVDIFTDGLGRALLERHHLIDLALGQNGSSLVGGH